MKRIGVFVLYDEDGIVDDFIEYLLLKMREVLNKLVIVVNGDLKRESEKILQKYSGDLFYRRNIGYDGGAYKEAVLRFISKTEWEQYDEAVFFNDTFYGPFFSMKTIFERFDQEKVDFWGLSKWIDGHSALLEQKLPEHLQTYFLVVKKSILQSVSFFDFWLSIDDPLTYKEAILNFEVAFTRFFFDRGFRYKSLVEMQGAEQLLEPGRVVYHAYPCKLILDFHFPVLKRKSVNMYNIEQIVQILEYIEKDYGFDTSIVWKHLKRLETKKRIAPFSFLDIDEFYRCHERIFVYGNGIWGRKIEAYFKYRCWKIEAFIVTDNQTDRNACRFRDVVLNDKDGIIVALGKNNLKQVESLLLEKFNRNQIYFPMFE